MGLVLTIKVLHFKEGVTVFWRIRFSKLSFEYAGTLYGQGSSSKHAWKHTNLSLDTKKPTNTRWVDELLCVTQEGQPHRWHALQNKNRGVVAKRSSDRVENQQHRLYITLARIHQRKNICASSIWIRLNSILYNYTTPVPLLPIATRGLEGRCRLYSHL